MNFSYKFELNKRLLLFIRRMLQPKCYLYLTDIQHAKNCFALNNFTPTVFIEELLKFHNAKGRYLKETRRIFVI